MGGWYPWNSHLKGKRLIIMHIGNEDGFVEAAGDVFESNFKGDYHDYLNTERFEKWFENNLPKLGDNSVVVVDDAPHHSRRQEITPTTSWKKVDIQDWLRSKEIHFDEDEVTIELLKKVKETKSKFQTYAVDELAKRYNVEVLRLPPHHCELNAIELVWAEVKWHVARNNASFKLKDVKKLLLEGLQNVTAEKWRDCVQYVAKEGDEFYDRIDEIIDTTIDSLVLNVDDSDSACSDFESEDSYSSVDDNR
ncbi:hypothetical protein EVAR_77490_1 [Eumeta japonica]|uniref:Tc1-like transposase DDE domain-containing protein n=1 Tax=Eumeta variegata TaxID=151549 RepID=A0A4C1T9S5_EUMVA|nr:hypothetical protein EVAR_77490_1 [Eumeta japonica]